MGVGHVSYSTKAKCWNLYDSYGMICVHCGCCANDKKTRYEARITCLKDWLHNEETFEFDDDPEFRAIQEKNVAANIKYFKRRLRYYEKKLEGVEASG